MATFKDLIDCMRVRPVLQSYLDGELDRDSAAAAMVARHLEACGRCGMAADSIQSLKRHVARLRTDPSPEQMARMDTLIDHLAGRPSGPAR